MKKQLITLVLSLVFGTAAFAQSTFTEQTFNTIMEGYKKDPAKFLRNDVTADFFIVNDGNTSNAETVAGWNDACTENLNEWSDVKVHQYGNTAVATCEWKQAHHWKTGNWARFSNLTSAVFTYQNNKWVLASWAFLPLKLSPKPIKSVIYHKVEDYAKWKAVFDAALGFRQEFGELSAESGTLADDPKTVYVIQEWKTRENMQKIFASPKLKEEMGKSGVVSAPTILILNENAK